MSTQKEQLRILNGRCVFEMMPFAHHLDPAKFGGNLLLNPNLRNKSPHVIHLGVYQLLE